MKQPGGQSPGGCTVRSRRWRVVPLAWLVVVGSCSGSTSDKKDDHRGPSAIGAEARETSHSDGPGLRGTSTDSLKLPVPGAFDLSHVEARYFARALGNDPTRIFEFVRDQIAFEPYTGCLRGPRGTLIAMAGNAVDRAALLGELLTKSGQQVRYAHATLEKSLAEGLVASIWEARPSATDDDAEELPPELKADLGRLLEGVRRRRVGACPDPGQGRGTSEALRSPDARQAGEGSPGPLLGRMAAGRSVDGAGPVLRDLGSRPAVRGVELDVRRVAR